MRMTFIAGALALAAIGLCLNMPAARADEFGTTRAPAQSASIDIDHIHSVLKLTPQQERYWRPVEVALRHLAQHQQQGSEQDGFVRRMGRRAVSIVLNSAAIERLAVAARPLIATLNNEQKQAAGRLAQEMGLGPVLMAALN